MRKGHEQSHKLLQYCAPVANGLRSQTQMWVAQLAPDVYALPNNTFRVTGGAAIGRPAEDEQGHRLDEER